MSHPHIVPLTACADPALAGGKAVGLHRLIRDGFPVPSGFCLTTTAYRDTLQAIGFDAARRWRQALAATGVDRDRLLSDCRRPILSCTIDRSILHTIGNEPARWAVRSSATDEDAADATFAGLYATSLNVPADGITAAILHCWDLDAGGRGLP
jgi:rifampicin phosphotransferase